MWQIGLTCRGTYFTCTLDEKGAYLHLLRAWDSVSDPGITPQDTTSLVLSHHVRLQRLAGSARYRTFYS